MKHGLETREEDRQREVRNATDAKLGFALEEPLPESIDWRDHGGNWISPAKDQALASACVAFSTCATLEARAMIQANDPSMNLLLSEADLFWCGCDECRFKGWDFVPALERCRDHGVGLASQFPYKDDDQTCQPIPPRVRVSSWTTHTTLASRQHAVANRGPMIAGLGVFEDLYYYVGGTYRHIAGKHTGSHAVSVIGYDIPGGYWIVKNSWGETWGQNGFGHMAFDGSGLDATFPFYDPVVTLLPESADG